MARAYEQRKRAVRFAETSRRVVEATVALHLEVGPAETTISEVARRAGVQRVTVYNHFPDEASLFAACSEHWRALHPAPDPATWAGIREPRERTLVALCELYCWFRETEPMTAHVLRDMELLPALRAVVESGLGRYLESVRALLAEPFRARGRRRERLEAAIRAATDFHTWRALSTLGDREAARLATRLVEVAR